MADKQKSCIYIGVGLAVITIAVAIFDLITDWIALRDFIRYDGGKMTVALGIFCAISTILFIFEIRNGIVTYRLAQRQMMKLKRKDGKPPSPAADTEDREVIFGDTEETRLELWKEVLSFLLLAFEDFPATIIIYIVFERGPCPLYTRLFQQSFTAYLALLGSFVSALWKLLMAFVYCCRLCRCQFRHVKGFCAHVCCCCCRLMRPLLAVILMGFAGYLYSKYSDGEDPRPECRLATTMAAGLVTTTKASL